MPHYVVVLEGGAPPRASARQLGRMTEAMAVWIDELRAARVLVARGATAPRRVSTLTGEDVLGCVVIAVDGDDDASAVAATCPADSDIRFTVVRLRPEPSAEVWPG